MASKLLIYTDHSALILARLTRICLSLDSLRQSSKMGMSILWRVDGSKWGKAIQQLSLLGTLIKLILLSSPPSLLGRHSTRSKAPTMEEPPRRSSIAPPPALRDLASMPQYRSSISLCVLKINGEIFRRETKLFAWL